MRFRIVNDKNNQTNTERQSSKDQSTRQNSGNKYNKASSFLQMVKNSYQYYLHIGKNQLKQQQYKIATIKQENKKKIIKKQTLAEQRKSIKLTQQPKNTKRQQSQSQSNNQISKPIKKYKKHHPINKLPQRKSQRLKPIVSYNEAKLLPIDDQQLFDVLDMQQQKCLQKKYTSQKSQSMNQYIVIPDSQQNIQNESVEQIKVQKYDRKLKFQQNQDNVKQSIINFNTLNKQPIETSVKKQVTMISPVASVKSLKNQIIEEKMQKLKEQLIFEEQGTYQITMAHEAVLRAQKFMDQHINFKHEIRQIRYIQISSLMKYMKSHGFITFTENKFDLLTRINPYLYERCQKDKNYIMTYKLNGLQIQKRLQSTKRRMTQVSIPELFT